MDLLKFIIKLDIYYYLIIVVVIKFVIRLNSLWVKKVVLQTVFIKIVQVSIQKSFNQWIEDAEKVRGLAYILYHLPISYQIVEL